MIDFQGDTIKVNDTLPIFDFLLYKPQISKKRVLIINNCEKLNIETQSSLLKTLEEPKNNTIIILITTNPQKLLKTINSRLLSIRFTKPSQNDIIDFIKNKYPNYSKNLSHILELSHNRPAQVINYIRDQELLKNTDNNIKIFNDLSKNNFDNQSTIIKNLMTHLQSQEETNQTDDKEKFIKTYLKTIINDWINNIEREIHTALQNEPLVSLSKIKRFKNTLQLLSYVDNYNANYRLLLEAFCITTFN
ncbi:MAG TPA: hypothetical protein P5052_04890 [Candidatus Paceibacterota bacterium]|nr:hypothetical protein [Candidatus Paceibacterota bacterium]HRZ30019.1 hypothetical protein [Candidatus Paceibacterota bacterium]